VGLAPLSAALLLLQRVRDESHRFAIQYHRELRSKAGVRSVLDELPGIGPGKRKALLRALGSLEGVRRASEAELAAVPRVTAADAPRILRFFRTEPVAPESESEPAETLESRGVKADPSSADSQDETLEG